MIKSVFISVHSIKTAMRPGVVMTLGEKLKIIVDFEAGKRVIIRNVETDLCCCKGVLAEI